MDRDRSKGSRTSSRLAIVSIAAFGAAASAGCFALKSDAPIPLDPAANPPQSDFYVDPSGALAGSYLTITEAIVAANASGADAKVIHVSPGNYRAPSETFPLVLRDGVSLEGSSMGDTSILGTGPIDVAPPPNSTTPVSAAIVIGDAVKASHITHITFPQVASKPDGQEAILCDRGNAGTDAPENVVIDDAHFRGFEVGVRVMALPGTSGCHVRITRSTFEDGFYGVLAQGIVHDDGSPVSVVSVHLGDGSLQGGNSFTRLRIGLGNLAGLNGSGLCALPGSVGVTASHNTFSHGDRGITIVQGRGGDRTHGVTIDHNDFGFLEMTGLVLHGNTTLATITNNHFHDIAESAEASALVGPLAGTGFVAQVYDGFGAILARGNTFETCSIGVQILATQGAASLNDADLLRIDFGSPSTAGNNVFRCNSSTQAEANSGSGSTSGGDVFFAAATTGSTSLNFEGNTWDHVPPTAEVGVSSVDPGIDILAQGTYVDATRAKLSSLACQDPYVRGP